MKNEDLRRLFGLDSGEYYVTAPAPCPYLHGKVERKVFSYLGGQAPDAMNSVLTQRGFRRSQNIIYLPACDGCQACVPVRIVAREFEFSGSRKRVCSRNSDLTRSISGPNATTEQFSLLRGYLDDRHHDGGMADMTVLDYSSMVEETAVDTVIVEYRANDDEKTLIACALTDRLADGLSMVYSFFEPEAATRSLGKYMILDHVRLANELELPYVYLGYWVDGSPKMAYKEQYAPMEMLVSGKWVAMPVE